jgi:hypothetical protein
MRSARCGRYPRIESDSGRGWYRFEKRAEAAGLLTPPSAELNSLRRIRHRLGGADMARPKAEGAVVIAGAVLARSPNSTTTLFFLFHSTAGGSFEE